jgi:Protein of unknown function (DUF3151)
MSPVEPWLRESAERAPAPFRHRSPNVGGVADPHRDLDPPAGPGPASPARPASPASPVQMSPGLPSTVLPPADPAAEAGLAAALGAEPDRRRAEVAGVVAAHPRDLAAWATLGDLGEHPIDRYAAYRVGYHRGLDALRANGWRGSGYVRWSAPSNRGFLRSLVGLGEMATAIGETDEAARVALFLSQLDPDRYPPSR